jgi:hypothetical protein
VLSAGDDFHPALDGWFSQTDTAEIYSPPYLFQPGTRPTIQTAPAEIGYSKQFTVTGTGGANRAVLMAPGAATHGFDMQQRNVELEVEGVSGASIRLQAPSGGGVAPPGHYMLFVLNSDGVPSIAEWVHLDEPAKEPVAPKAIPKETPPDPGPEVAVKLLRPNARGVVRAIVTSDEAATVKVRVKLTAKGRKAGGRSAKLRFKGAGKRRIGIRPKGRLRKLRAKIWVDARDPQGNASAWARKMRVPRR